MINFTVGPVQVDDTVLSVGSEQIPYFRTPEFSKIMLENEHLIKKLANAPDNARAVFLTGSGTAAMEAAVLNTLSSSDKALIVNGGSFGQRFVLLCQIYGIAYDEIRLEPGKALTEQQLRSALKKDKYTALLVNAHETSTGVLYDMKMISHYCKQNSLFLIVDAISSFLADELNMSDLGADVLITGSQKALACPPGVSILVLSERAIHIIESREIRCLYLNLKEALVNGERGQTPFTPAVGILRQLHARLQQLDANGGAIAESRRIAALAMDFRAKIQTLPIEIVSESLSNAVTPLHPLKASAYSVFLTLKDEYNIWICPNGGALRDSVFRVGHIGNLTMEDNTKLVNAFIDMQKRGLLS